MNALRWKNLKDGLCPKCSSRLFQEAQGAPLFCPRPAEACGFMISERKLQMILESRQPVPEAQEEEALPAGSEIGDVEDE